MGVYACKYQIIRCKILMLVCGCHIFLHLMLLKLNFCFLKFAVLLMKAVIFLFIICGFWPTGMHRSGENFCSVGKKQTVFVWLNIAEKLCHYKKGVTWTESST